MASKTAAPVQAALSAPEAADVLPTDGGTAQSAEPQYAPSDAEQVPMDGELSVDMGEWRSEDAWGGELPNAEPQWDDSGAIAARQAGNGGLCGLPRAEQFSLNPADIRF